jgi:multidrug efflux pump subunit AcrA (membrane-fusion protein)
VGQKTRISLNTNKNNPVDAVVSKIYPAFDIAEQSFILEASFVADDQRIFANTQLQANIIIDERENALVIPAEYLRDDNTVILADNSEVTVDIGLKSSHWVEILGGIDETQLLKGRTKR